MRITSVLCVLLGLTVLGCQKKPAEQSGSKTATGAPTLEELKNTEYTGFEEVSRTVHLSGGAWEGAPYDSRSEVRPHVIYVKDMRLEGDLDGNGSPEAVAFLAFASGGSGDLLHIVVLDRRQGAVMQRANAIVGDRVQIRGARIEGANIVLDLVEAAPGDPACCPAELVTRRWQLEGDSLVERPSGIPHTRLSPEATDGVDWKLKEWNLGEPAPEDPTVTLIYTAGRWSGNSGCNRYAASVSSGENPGDVIVGPSFGTRMACEPTAAAMERRFLTQLGATKRIGFYAGRLALTYAMDDSLGTMLFEPAPAAPDTTARP